MLLWIRSHHFETCYFTRSTRSNSSSHQCRCVSLAYPHNAPAPGQRSIQTDLSASSRTSGGAAPGWDARVGIAAAQRDQALGSLVRDRRLRLAAAREGDRHGRCEGRQVHLGIPVAEEARKPLQMREEQVPSLRLLVEEPGSAIQLHVAADEVGGDLVALVEGYLLDPVQRQAVERRGVDAVHGRMLARNAVGRNHSPFAPSREPKRPERFRPGLK
jgi:hypothetical protein